MIRPSLPLLLLFTALQGAAAQPATFGPAATYAIGGASYRVAAADFDLDGAPDLVAATFSEDGVSVLMNEGDGTFGAAIVLPVTNAVRTVGTGDFDGDGDPDIVASASLSELHYLYLAGGGSFSPALTSVDFAYGGNAVDLAVADFDRDGLPDVALLGQSVVRIFSSDGDGTFTGTAAITGFSGSFQHGGIVARDLNGDLWPDIAFANGDGAAYVALADGAGGFGAATDLEADVSAYGIAAADLDGDGDLDLAVSSDSAVRILLNDGSGTFEVGGTSGAAGFAPGWSLAAGDLNLDGHPDILSAAASSGVTPHFGDGQGSLSAGTTIPMSLGNTYGVALADLDGDSKPDIVASGTDVLENELAVRLNQTVQSVPAVAVDDLYVTPMNQQLTVPAPGVLANDSGVMPLTASLWSLPDHGVVVGQEDGSFIYYPALGFTGTDRFMYDLLDGEGQWDVATVTIEVGAAVVRPLFVETGGELAGEEPHVARRRPGSVDIQYLAEIAAGEGGEILLNLFGDLEAVAYQERAEWRGETGFTWWGRLVDFERDRVIIVVDLEKETMTGNMTFDGRPFQVRPVGPGVHEALEIDQAGFPEGEDFSPPEEGPAGKGGSAGAVVAPQDSHPVIDMLVVYTDDAEAASADILSEIRLAIDETNTGFEQSGIDAEVRLVGAEMVPYAESKDGALDRNRVRNPTDGHLDGVPVLRESYGADVVALWVEDPGPDLCGIAFIMEEVDTSFRGWAYFVVRRTCATGNYSFGHELGHVMGARHDRFVDDTDGKPYDYNHGYVDVADGWRTVMGYNDACDCSDETGTEPDTCPADEDRATAGPACTRLLFWSDPGNSWNTPGNGQPGGPMGIASGSEAADNVRALNASATTVAAFSSENVHTISGFVRHLDTGQGVPDVIMGGFPIPDTTDAGGYYEVLVPNEWSGIVTPSLPPFRFDPPLKSYTLVTQSSAQDFTAIPPPRISGTITEAGTGLPIEGALVLGFQDEVYTDAAGTYVGWVDFGWSGTLVPLAAGYNMTPVGRNLSNVLGDLAGQDFEGTPGVLADSEWPLTGRTPSRSAGGTGSPVLPGTRWTYEDGSRWPSSPVVGPGGLVYVATVNGRLRALDPAGNPVWLAFPASPPDPGGLAVGAGGILYMTQSSLDHLSGGALSAVLPDGSGTAWSVSFQERIDVAPNLGPSGTLYVGTAGGDLVALDAADGTERWRFETTDGAVSAPALTGDETIVVGTGAGRVHAVNADGSLRWTYDTGSTSSSAPALAPDGTVYIGSDDGRVWAIDATGSLEWSYPTGGPVRAVPALGPGGEVYVGSDDGHLYALSGGGQLRWKYPTGGPVTAGAAVTTHVSPFDPLLPGIQQTETVVYFGSSDGTVYAVNAGGTFTSSMPGTLRWSVGTDHPIEHAPALDLGTQTLYVSSGPRLWAFGGQPSGGTGLVQITSLGTVLDPELLELRDNIHILVALAGEGGFGGSAILGGLPEDPCQGGPLFIPDCTELRSGLGTATPLVEVPSLVDLQIGFVKEGFGDAVLGGDPDGLLSTYTTVLRDGGTYTGILAGTTHPELLAPNPDGLPTRLTVFEAPTGTGFGTGEPVYVGHFSTDLGTVEIRLSGSGTYTFGPLRYGELSDLAFVEPGAYEIQVVPLDGVAGKRRAALAASADLASVAGGPTGLLLAGFADPEANLDGPGLTMYRADGGGATEVIGVTTGSEAELPQHVTLEPAYPNPFNPVTVIAYTLPNERNVRLEVFDVLGRSVARLGDGPQAAGRHEVSFDAGRLAGGVYLVRLSAGRQVATRAVTLLK